MVPSPGAFGPVEMRVFGEHSFEQAKSAFDKFMDATQSTMNAFEGAVQGYPSRWCAKKS